MSSPTTVTPTLAFIGAGRAGTSLALALSRGGWPVTAIASRTFAAAARLSRLAGGTPYADPVTAARRCRVVVIATPDGAIGPVAAAVATGGGWHSGQVVLHLSGALESNVLAPARLAGAAVGSLHPLQTLAGGEDDATLLMGSYFGIEGDTEAINLAMAMAVAAGGVPLLLDPGGKALYHAAAVAASNYLCATAALATDLWACAGLPPEQALPALFPLIEGTVRNLKALGLPAALTGPIERGDAATVASHLARMQNHPDAAAAYRALGALALRLAAAKGLPGAAVSRVRTALAGETWEGGDPQ